jgi:hypothetical protein
VFDEGAADICKVVREISEDATNWRLAPLGLRAELFSGLMDKFVYVRRWPP